MATIQQLLGIVQPELKKIFDNFFSDKYNDETRELIFSDLWELIRNNYISEIIFCLYDTVLDKTVDGIILKIDKSPSISFYISKEIAKIVSPKLSGSSEKFLIVKLSEEFVERDKIEFDELDALSNNWDFINEIKINIKAEQKKLLCVDNFQMTWQGVSSE